jgi:predicted RNA binding protein YcfA (HicA-like mRNA interferase family)
MRSDRLLARLKAGHFANVRFTDALRLAAEFGFEVSRMSGSHRIISHPEIRELLNLQEHHGKAKPYQLRQLVNLIERYHLKPRRG